MKPRTDEELKQIAKDIYAGKIFTDKHMKASELSMLNLVFMPLLFADGDTKDEILEAANSNSIGLVYEYVDKALPRSINGLPMFMSMSLLSKDDTKKMDEYYQKVVDAMGGI